MSDLGRFLGAILGTSIIPFIFSFVGAFIGKKVGAFIAAVICGFLLLFGNIKQGNATPSEVFFVVICCFIQAFFCSLLVQKIRDIRNMKNQKNISTAQEEMANSKIDNQIIDETKQDQKVSFAATSDWSCIKNKWSKKKTIIIFSSFGIVFLGVFIYLYISNYHFNRWIQVYCFNDPGYARVLADDYVKKKEWEKATNLYFKALDSAKASNEKLEVFWTYRCLAKMFLAQKRYGAAIALCKEALEYNINQRSVYEIMAKAYDGAKNYTSAFEYYNKALHNSTILMQKHKLLTKEEKRVAEERAAAERVAEEQKGIIYLSFNDNPIIFKIALWYTYGQGCEKDLAKAANLWTYLANQADYSAML